MSLLRPPAARVARRASVVLVWLRLSRIRRRGLRDRHALRRL